MRELLLRPITKRAGLGAREIIVVASDSTVDRIGDVMVADGCDLSGYRRNPIVLANHDRSSPIGTFAPIIQNQKLTGTITFAPEGLSPKADEYCGLVKAGILRTVSVGFNPLEFEPMPGGGRRYTKWELLEVSLVTIPANPEALVVSRSASAIGKAGRVLSRENARSLRSAHNLMLSAHENTLEACDHIKRVVDQADDDVDDEETDDELMFAGGTAKGRCVILQRETRLREVEALGLAAGAGVDHERRLRQVEVLGRAHVRQADRPQIERGKMITKANRK